MNYELKVAFWIANSGSHYEGFQNQKNHAKFAFYTTVTFAPAFFTKAPLSAASLFRQSTIHLGHFSAGNNGRIASSSE
jgi:hypothetical protein